jgi:hypothetical protein
MSPLCTTSLSSLFIVLEWWAPRMGLYVSFVLDPVHLEYSTYLYINLLCLNFVARILNKIVKYNISVFFLMIRIWTFRFVLFK